FARRRLHVPLSDSAPGVLCRNERGGGGKIGMSALAFRTSSSRPRALPSVLYFVSGATGLAYQVLWVRELKLVFGASTIAVSTVLAAFMGGLALGGFAVARFADRLPRPLRAYGLLEIGVGAYALLFPLLVTSVTPIYLAVWRALEPGPMIFGLVQFALVGSILLLPTAAMGATLPLLARATIRELGRAGDRIGTLYAVNTFGAVAGAALCAFVLLPELDARESSARARHGRHLGHARRGRVAARSGRRARDRHRFLGVGLQLVGPEGLVPDPACAADPDRYRSAGDRQDLPGHRGHRRRCEGDARGVGRTAEEAAAVGRGDRRSPTRCRRAQGGVGAGARRGPARFRPSDPSRAAARRDRQGAARGRGRRHGRRLEQERRGPTAVGAATQGVHHERRFRNDGLRARRRNRREARRARSESRLPRRRRRLHVGPRRADDGGRARYPGALRALQQLLLLDDSKRRNDLFREHLRHRVHDAGRQAVQPGFPAAREVVRYRVRARRGSGRARGGAAQGNGRQRALPARGAHARRHPDAAHGLLGHRGLPAARQRLVQELVELRTSSRL